MRRWLSRLSWWRRPEPSLFEQIAAADAPLLALLFDTAPIGALLIDSEGRVRRANPAMVALAGSPIAAGDAAASLFAPDDPSSAWPDIEVLLRGRPARLQSVTAPLIRPEGGRIAVQVTADPLIGPEGAQGALIRVVDMSLQAELEAQLAQSQKLQAVGQLAGGIAHDFNNLLTAVLGSAESIATRDAIAPDVREDAEQIQSAAMRGAALVRQLLAFGRRQALQPRPLAINAVITNISDLLRRLIGEKVRLELQLESPGRTVRADPTQLDQVLVNLAVNARDAMQDGGVLTIGSGHMTLFRPLASGAETIPPGRYVMVEVCDTGKGMAPEVVARIFDPFFTTKRDRGGTGLGLSTVHGIIRQSGGFVAVESEVGVGTRFRLYLPRWDDQDAVAIPRVPEDAAPPAPPEPEVEPAKRRLLLVEDEEPVRRLAERQFRRRGWDVLAAESGEAALALLDEGAAPPDVVVTDMIMPGMDGTSLLAALRARPGLADLPAVIVSGYNEEMLRRDLESTLTLFLAKPYMPAELIARVELALANARRAALTV